MNREQTQSNMVFLCNIIPPYILENIISKGNDQQREFAERTLQQDKQMRAMRATRLQRRIAAVEQSGASTARKNRMIYTANNTATQPGTLVRSEGQKPSGDVEVDEAYDGFGATFDLFWDIYKRNSIDGNGLDMIATVHYDYHYNNAFWDGTQMVFGDGDGTMFNRFTIAIDIMGHELAHGVTEHTANLEYQEQSGALNESISDVFGSLVKQRTLNQTADQADWLIGAGLLAEGINGVALRSMKAPGTAYDDWLLGKDPQPDHMSKYVETTSDNGGVHTNSGIPNKAFYLAAVGIGGKAWEVAGNIWYQTLLDPRLSNTAKFQEFADLTVDNAGKLYNSTIKATVAKAWKDVGIKVEVKEVPKARELTAATNKDGRLELFYINADDAIYHNWQVSPGGNWSGWSALGGKAKELTVAQNQDGRLQIFCIGIDDAFYYNIQVVAGGTWSGWKPLDNTVKQIPVVKKQEELVEV